MKVRAIGNGAMADFIGRCFDPPREAGHFILYVACSLPKDTEKTCRQGQVVSPRVKGHYIQEVI
eukprot:2661347-Amphidinium_carterae.1